MSSRLAIVHDANVTPGWAALVLTSVLRIPAETATSLVMQLHSAGRAELTGYVDDPAGAAQRLACLGMDVALSSGVSHD